MKKIVKGTLLAGVAAMMLLALGTDVLAQRSQTFRVDAGTRFRVRMNETISSKTAKRGDTFTTTVREPVYSNNGVVVIPVGSEVVGRVDAVRKAERGGDPGTIDVSFTEVKLPNGTRRAINGSLTDLVSDDAKSDTEGTAKGDKMKNRKIIFIGGGGAGGAVLGAAIGGGKGALIGGIIGAGAGLLGERLTKGEDAEVKSGTEFGVYLNRAISLPRFTEVGTDDDRYEAPPAGARTYIVRPGDTLGTISRRFYGTSARYMDIYNANRDRLPSPNSVTVGQELIIP
ncbi:MAG: LysM peptidoglycan-binding domain-containing protein [Acidobacteria bacterium]|nr:LysM peptidoglycan-binding domain-containing protein [Acidobacteriota bacterium]